MNEQVFVLYYLQSSQIGEDVKEIASPLMIIMLYNLIMLNTSSKHS